MTEVVESLKRLYINKSLTKEQIKDVKETVDILFSAEKISIDEYHYITGKDGE